MRERPPVQRAALLTQSADVPATEATEYARR